MVPTYLHTAPPNTISVHTGQTIPAGTPIYVKMPDPTGSGIPLHGIVQQGNFYQMHRPHGKR
jgi:hypothetical protein